MAKPFLKWAGGKRQLITTIEGVLPKNIEDLDTYIEPFIGGGALLFHFLEKNQFKNWHISDINPELILCYKRIKDSVKSVNTALNKLISEYPTDNESRATFFYEIRSQWNSNLDIENMSKKKQCDRVAQTIFLNKTCFNGLFRLNRKGEFNVPTGKYVNPSFPSNNDLIAVSKALSNVKIHLGAYDSAIDWIEGETLVYFDPPYRPLSKTSSFVSYSKGDFNDEDQNNLAEFCNTLNDRNVKFILSNSDPKNTVPDDDFFDDLYSNFTIQRIHAGR
ncbi:MAG: Dam family site-specific DNA-(adenine-N6)-methyltransferase, partial [Euryarchaeota archaeon]|nr:Dam family site-specific DNA-(adenine-N6)-methyltransferase [Euryarchaeota archaeon]